MNATNTSAPNRVRTGATLSADQGRCKWIAISLKRPVAVTGRRTPT